MHRTAEEQNDRFDEYKPPLTQPDQGQVTYKAVIAPRKQTGEKRRNRRSLLLTDGQKASH